MTHIGDKPTKLSARPDFNARSLDEIRCGIAASPEATAEALFSTGYAMERAGDLLSAQGQYRNAISVLETLRDDSPGILSNNLLSKISLNHGIRLVKLKNFGAAVAPLTSSIRFVEAMIESGVSAEMIEILASALRWLGLAQRAAGRHHSASLSYRRSAEIWRNLIALSSDSLTGIRRRRALAATLFGEGKNLALLGRYELAEKRRAESSEIYRKLRA